MYLQSSIANMPRDRTSTPHRLIQHKRFYGTHPNFCFAKTSFMLETLGEIYGEEKWKRYIVKTVVKN